MDRSGHEADLLRKGVKWQRADIALLLKGVKVVGWVWVMVRRGVKAGWESCERCFAYNFSYGKIIRVFWGGIRIEYLFCR